MSAGATLSRRTLLQAGAGLVVGWGSGGTVAQAVTVAGAADSATARELNGWVRIAPDGGVTLAIHRAEMGQGALTAVAMLLAEELEVDPAAVQIVFAPAAPERYGSQVTGGSTTVREGWKPLLAAGATARDRLVRAAAARLQVDAAACHARDGRVHHPASGRSLGYGTLADEAARLAPRSDVAPKPCRDWRLAGRSVPRLDLPSKVDGSALFGIDFRLPGMRFAVVERAPRFRARIAGHDASGALAVPGVLKVVRVEREVFGQVEEGLAVVATSTWAALQGRRALRVRWHDTVPLEDSAGLRERQLAALRAPMPELRRRGDPAAALAAPGTVLDATYETPYQAHAAIEPPNCTARVSADAVEVWGPLQAPDWVRDHLARRLQRPKEQVRVQMTLLGGSFGRKAFVDFAAEAVQLAHALPGEPVQLLWTREDDLAQGPFRPGMAYRLRGRLRDGRIDALEVLGSGPNFAHQEAGADPRQPNASLVEGLPEPLLEGIAHLRFADAALATAVPTLWWRAVYASTNAFAFESFVDELAQAGGLDPLALRRRHFADAGAARHVRLVDALAERSGWAGRRAAAGREGWGAAVVECFGSLVGQVVVVSRRARGLGIDRVVVVIDCGWALHPDGVRAQVEGSVVMALGAATTHEVRFANGAAVARDFAAYPLPRLADVPPIEVHLLPSDDAPGGAGEPALPGIAPALANAVADLSGRRLRRLPFALAKV